MAWASLREMRQRRIAESRSCGPLFWRRKITSKRTSKRSSDEL